MQWHINDLSLDGQFADAQALRMALEPLLMLRRRDPLVRERLYCSRRLGEQRASPTATFAQAIRTMDKLFQQLALEWLNKSGPFWNDDRQANPDDYFEYQGQDVTEQGLGEAARRKLAGIEAGVFSFTGSRAGFEFSPLSVQHGLSEAPLDAVEISNLWTVCDLAQAAQLLRPEPRNWPDTLQEAQRRFSGLILADTIAYTLQPEPFNRCVMSRVFELLRVLDQLVVQTDAQGHLSALGMDLINNHFVGEKAWFTDESATNKTLFQQELTFPDPDAPVRRIFCPWHGKIKTPQFRIHFEWPRPAGQKKIKVVYIGPKITKT